mgnify:CR=1 FL=1
MNDVFVTGAVALIVCIINNFYQAKATRDQHDKTIGLIEYKLDELTKKVEKHNNVVERITVVENDLKTTYRLIDTLRSDINSVKK